MTSEYSSHNHHIRVTRSALAELNSVIYQLQREGEAPKYSHPWREHMDAQRPDLVRRVRSLWGESHYIMPRGQEMFLTAAYFGYLPGDDPESFFVQFSDLIARLAGDEAIARSGNPTPEPVEVHIERMHALLEPDVQAKYLGLLRDLWAELVPMWERDGLSIVDLECARLRQRLDEGADLLELLPPKHFLQFDEYTASVRSALDEQRPIVVTPLYFAGGGYLLDPDVEGTPLFLGYSSRFEGVHQATWQQATDVALRLKAFSDPTRLTVLSTIGELDVTVGDLAKLLDITQPSISGHLKVLQEAGLVTVRKRGVKSFYRSDAQAIEALIKDTRDLLL